MSGGTNSSTALLTEHLRHTPVSLIDDIINSINTIGYKAVDWVEQGLLGTPLSDLGFQNLAGAEQDQRDKEAAEEKARQEIENGVHQFETLLEATIDKNFDIMEVFALRTIISIPEDLRDWIRLRHYEGLNLVLSPDAPTIESITLQRRKYQENQRLQRLLQAEASRNAALIAQLKALLSPPPPPNNAQPQAGPKAEPLGAESEPSPAQPPPHPAFAFLSHKGDLPHSSASTPLSTTAAFALSQLGAQKALLAELRPQLRTLASPPRVRDPNLAHELQEEKSWRRQRLEYVEAQTKRLQENVRGLELGAQGEVRDGEWQEQGRRVGRKEVEALERVVAMVSGEAESAEKGREMDIGDGS